MGFGDLFTPRKTISSKWMSPDMMEAEEGFEETVRLFDSIGPAVKGVLQSQQTNVKKLEDFSKAMSSYGSGEKYPLSKVFEKSAQGQSALAATQKKYLENYQAVVVKPIEDFTNKEIKEAKAKRKLFKAEAAKYDSKLSQVSKLQASGPEKADKLAVAKKELEKLEDSCIAMKAALLERYELMNQEKRTKLTSVMREMGMIQLEHLNSSQDALAGPHREIESLSVDLVVEAASAKSSGAPNSPSMGGSMALPGQGANDLANPFLDDEDAPLTPRSDEE